MHQRREGLRACPESDRVSEARGPGEQAGCDAPPSTLPAGVRAPGAVSRSVGPGSFRGRQNRLGPA